MLNCRKVTLHNGLLSEYESTNATLANLPKYLTNELVIVGFSSARHNSKYMTSITEFLVDFIDRYTKALEAIKKLHKEQAQEIKTYKLKLENLQTLKDAAYKVFLFRICNDAACRKSSI